MTTSSRVGSHESIHSKPCTGLKDNKLLDDLSPGVQWQISSADRSGYLPEFCITPMQNISGLLQFIPEIQRFILYQVEQRSTVLIKRRIVLQNSSITWLLNKVAHLSLLDLSQMIITCLIYILKYNRYMMRKDLVWSLQLPRNYVT